MPTSEDVYRQRTARIEAIGVKNLASASEYGCYAGAMACAMTVLGLPTTARETERHWACKPNKRPGIMDLLALDDWALSKGLKLHEITPPGTVNLEKYYKPGSKLTYEDFMKETTAIYGSFYAEWAAKNYSPDVYKAEMSKRRERAGRIKQTRAPITRKLVEQLLVNGPVIVQDTDPHSFTLYATNGPLVGLYDPGRNGQLGGWPLKNIMKELDPQAAVLALSR